MRIQQTLRVEGRQGGETLRGCTVFDALWRMQDAAAEYK